MTTFDRYLLTRYLHVVMVFTVACIGLFAVVDGFTTLDDFQKRIEDEHLGTGALLARMGTHYLFQSALIVDLIGPTILVLSAMCLLALMLKQGEIHPVLAAGVPTYRWSGGLLAGLVLMSAALALNQEWVLPAIAPRLQGQHGDPMNTAQPVDATYDFSTGIHVNGSGAIPAERKLLDAEFRLSVPQLATDSVVLRGRDAIYYPAEGNKPAGWLVRGVNRPLTNLPLTPAGLEVVIPQASGQDVFLQVGLTMDQICHQASNQRLVGTPQLLHRVREWSGPAQSRNGVLVHLHNRLTRPVLSLIGLYLVIPLIVRKEKMSILQQVTNLAVCCLVLGVVFGSAMGCQFLGQSGLLRPVQAVWLPLIGSGGLAAWLSGIVRT